MKHRGLKSGFAVACAAFMLTLSVGVGLSGCGGTGSGGASGGTTGGTSGDGASQAAAVTGDAASESDALAGDKETGTQTETESGASDAAEPDEDQNAIGSDPMSLPPYSFHLESVAYADGDISITYPKLVGSNLQERESAVNDAILADLKAWLASQKPEDGSAVTITGDFSCDAVARPFVSIRYVGLRSAADAAYPVNLYHTFTVSLDAAGPIALSDLYRIDADFVDAFLSGMYAPYEEDLDLEASGVDIVQTVTQDRTTDDLIALFSKPDANFWLAEQGLLLSVEVPHALGDHLELAMNFEWLESSMKRESPAWASYLYLDEGGTSGEEGMATEKETVKESLAVGDMLAVVLEENLSTGYSWSCEIGDPAVMKVASENAGDAAAKNGGDGGDGGDGRSGGSGSAAGDEPVAVGAPGSHSYELSALKAGSTTVTFTYARPWEKDADPAKVVEYLIEVK